MFIFVGSVCGTKVKHEYVKNSEKIFKKKLAKTYADKSSVSETAIKRQYAINYMYTGEKITQPARH